MHVRLYSSNKIHHHQQLWHVSRCQGNWLKLKLSLLLSMYEIPWLHYSIFSLQINSPTMHKATWFVLLDLYISTSPDTVRLGCPVKVSFTIIAPVCRYHSSVQFCSSTHLQVWSFFTSFLYQSPLISLTFHSTNHQLSSANYTSITSLGRCLSNCLDLLQDSSTANKAFSSVERHFMSAPILQMPD